MRVLSWVPLVLASSLGAAVARGAPETYTRVYLDDHHDLHAVTTLGLDVRLTSRGRYADPKLSSDGRTIGVRVTERVTVRDGENANLGKEIAIYRNRHLVRRLPVDGWVRDWGFWNGDRQVAIYSGALHFAGYYSLRDLRTGAELAASEDPVTDASPDWVRSLER